MDWWQAILLGIVQGLTEFLPVSSSGHLMIFKELLGVDAEGFLDFTVTVHFATVLATIVVFWGAILQLLKGLFKFKYNDETDYICKMLVSLIPVMIVGFFFKDQVDALFSGSLKQVAVGLCITAALLLLSDQIGKRIRAPKAKDTRNGISYGQAALVGVAQAFAVVPGVSRSGSTIATGLLSGVKRDVMAQFSFLMVLAPIVGEQCLDLLKVATGEASFGDGVGSLPLLLGFVAAFPTSEVISGYTAFLLGVRSVVPQAVMRVCYTQTWSSYAQEKEAAQQLIAEGCVIISQHTDTIGPAIACEEASENRSVYFVGYNQSMSEVAPSSSLVTSRICWEKYVLAAVDAVMRGKQIESVVSGRIHGTDVSAGFEKGWVEMTDLNRQAAAPGTQEAMDSAIELFRRGRSDFVFKGDYTGVDPDDPKDTIDLRSGYAENEITSFPTFHYILNDVITII